MARPKPTPINMTFAEWQAQCCPPVVLTAVDICTWTGLTAMAVTLAVQSGKLVRVKSKFDTAHPANKEWLLDRVGRERPEGITGRPPRQPAATRPAPPPQQPPTGSTTPGYGEDMLDLGEVLDALRNLDLTKLSANAVQKVARIETALKTRVERELKRGLLIDRTLVANVFSKLYQVDCNQFKTLGAKVAPEVAAKLGVEDPATLLEIEKYINDEVLKVLTHIKRLIDDFLVGVGGEPI